MKKSVFKLPLAPKGVTLNMLEAALRMRNAREVIQKVSECTVHPFSSSICSKGVKGCQIDHKINS